MATEWEERDQVSRCVCVLGMVWFVSGCGLSESGMGVVLDVA